MPHFLCNLDRQKVVTAVLVAFDIRMPDDVVIQKELPAVYLPVNKRTVLFVREENRGPRLLINDLFHEIDDQSIKALPGIGKDGI